MGLLDAIGGVGGLGFHVYYGGDGIPAAPHRAICARSGGTRLRPPTQYGVRLRTSNPDYGPTTPAFVSSVKGIFYLQGTRVVEKVFNQTWVGALRLQFYLARRSNSTQLNWPAWKGSMQ